MHRTYNILTRYFPDNPSIIAKALNLTIEEVITKVQNNDPIILDYICRTYYIAPIELCYPPLISAKDFFAGDITPYYPAEFPAHYFMYAFDEDYHNNLKCLAEKYNITTPAQLGYATRRTWLNLYRVHLDSLNIDYLFKGE